MPPDHKKFRNPFDPKEDEAEGPPDMTLDDFDVETENE